MMKFKMRLANKLELLIIASAITVLTTVEGGPHTGPVWSEWSPWSPCSRSCDGGVMMRKRHCFTQDAKSKPCYATTTSSTTSSAATSVPSSSSPSNETSQSTTPTTSVSESTTPLSTTSISKH